MGGYIKFLEVFLRIRIFKILFITVVVYLFLIYQSYQISEFNNWFYVLIAIIIIAIIFGYSRYKYTKTCVFLDTKLIQEIYNIQTNKSPLKHNIFTKNL